MTKLNADVLTGKVKPRKKVTVVVLNVKSATKKAIKRGRITNHRQTDGRKQRHDHPNRPSEHPSDIVASGVHKKASVSS